MHYLKAISTFLKGKKIILQQIVWETQKKVALEF